MPHRQFLVVCLSNVVEQPVRRRPCTCLLFKTLLFPAVAGGHQHHHRRDGGCG